MPLHRTPFLGRPRPRVATWLAAASMLAASLLLCLPAQAQQPAGTAAPDTPIQARLLAQRLEWTPAMPHGRALLRLAREGETPQDVGLQSPLVLSLQSRPLRDGHYTYELTLAPATSTPRRDESGAVPIPPTGAMLAGSFTVAGGAFVLPPEVPPTGENSTADADAIAAQPSTLVTRSTRLITKDQVVSDDNIVQGSLCAGLDCVNNESFSFDTLRLKENNLRLKFEDTSTAPFPNNHWQLIANDSANGGANYFGIDDVTANRPIVRWLAGAPANSLALSPQGRVGVRTAVPILDVHVLSSDTPALRQEQNNTSGFTAQTWDIGGNEVNFFVRDLTAGSLLPLRIRPGAPHSSVDMAINGNVGLGTPRPAASLTLRRSNGTGTLLVDNTGAPSAARVPVVLQNNGAVSARFTHGPGTAYWTQQATSATLGFAANGNGSNALSVQSNGGLVVAGTLSQGSSRTLKHDIAPAPVQAILGEVAQLPVYAWRYLGDLRASLHLGPMAEDVHQRFQLGHSPQALAPSDVAGLAAATVQALHQQLAARDQELLTLAERLSTLERQLARQQNRGAQ